MVFVVSVELNSDDVYEHINLDFCKNYLVPLMRGCVKVVTIGIAIIPKTEQNYAVVDVLNSSKISHYDL